MAINISIPTPSLPSKGTSVTLGTALGVLGTVVYAVWGVWKGGMDPNTALAFALGAGGLGALHLHVSAKMEELLTQVAAQAQADFQVQGSAPAVGEGPGVTPVAAP